MHVGQKNHRLLQQTVIQIRKNIVFFCFDNVLPVLKKKAKSRRATQAVSSCIVSALFNFTYIYDGYPVKISRRFF